MTKTYFHFPALYENNAIIIEVDRPIGLQHRDEDIGNRSYEKIIGYNEDDKWTKEMDALIEMEGITYKQITKKELNKAIKNNVDMVIRV